jgi:hypothetical protein
MSDLIVPSAPALVTIPDVELCAVGTWHASTGTTTFTLQDMLDSVAALDCPGVRNPVLKLGHTEDDGAGIRWDGEPAVGWIGNMRMAADNAKIVGDFTGMPAWLAGVLPSAYPDRSVEIYRPFICQIGHVHPAAITAVALLGVSRPGVGVLRSLQDVAGLYGVEAAAKTAAQAVAVRHGDVVYLATTTEPKPPVVGRELTEAEQRSGVDPEAIQQAWQDALTAVLAAWPPISAAWVASLADQIRDAVDAGDTAALAAPSVDTGQGESALADATRELAATAAEQMAAEAATQGVEVEPPEQDDAHLAELATAVVLLIALGLAGAAGREALRRTAPGADGQAVADQVTTYLEGLSDSSLRTQLGGALSAAQGAGRRSVLEAAPPVRVIASEVLDQNTCSPCRDVDGTEWDNLAEALAAYPTGALYVGCLGRERCRGLLLGLWG